MSVTLALPRKRQPYSRTVHLAHLDARVSLCARVLIARRPLEITREQSLCPRCWARARDLYGMI